MTKSFKASPLGRASGLAIGHAGDQTFVAVVLPKFWRPDGAPDQYRIAWPEPIPGSEGLMIVPLYEGDRCTIELGPKNDLEPGDDEGGEKNTGIPEPGVRRKNRKAAIELCMKAAEDSAYQENDDEGSHDNDAPDQNLAPILGPALEVSPNQNQNVGENTNPDEETVQGAAPGPKEHSDPIKLIFDLLERAESAKVLDMDSQLDSTELTSTLLRPLLYRRLLKEIGANLHDIRRGYVRVVDVPRAVRGQITQHGLITYAATGAPELECSYDQFTEETPLFRVLVTALRMVASTGRPGPPFGDVKAFKELSGEAAGLAHHLASIRPLPRSQAAALASRLRLPRTLQRWEKALHLAGLVLREREHKPQPTGPEQSDAIAITLPTDKLWETILEQALRRGDLKFKAQEKVDSPWQGMGSTKNADFLVVRDDGLWCLDAKYKPSKNSGETEGKFTPSSADQNQLFAYSHLAGWSLPQKERKKDVSDCALIYPVAKAKDIDSGGDSYPRAPGKDVSLFVMKLPFPMEKDVRTAEAWSKKVGKIASTLDDYLGKPEKNAENKVGAK